MASPPTSLPFFSAPLAVALESIQFRLKRENAAPVIAATAQRSELSLEELPPHVQVTDRPLAGERVTVRGARYFRQTRLRIAHYPQVQMDETAVPVLLYVVSGLARIYVGDYVLQCRPGDFVLVPPLVPKGAFLTHAIDDDPRSTCDVLYIYPGRLLGKGLECWISHSQADKVTSSAQTGAALLKNQFIATLFHQLSTEIQRDARSEGTFLLLRSLVFFLLHEIKEERALLPEVKRLNQPVKQSHDPLAYALTYIDSHLSERLTIEDMARETALSKTTFKQLFRRETGHSFHQYLILLRLELARQLLRDTDLKGQSVAERVGLSPSRLNRLFHAHYGCSPGEYRRSKELSNSQH